MRIGVDLRSLEGGAQHRGIGRYASELLSALSKIDHTNEYVFFVSGPRVEIPTFQLHEKFSHSHAKGKGEGWRNVKYARIFALKRRPLKIDSYKLDVFFHIDIFQPIIARTTPVVSVLYDLIPFLYKDMYQHVHLGGLTPGHLIGYTRIKLRWKVHAKQLKSFRSAAQVISISEHSKKDLLSFLSGIKPENVKAIPLAAGELPPIPKSAPKRLAELKDKECLFYVGGADPRKGLVPLARTMEGVWKQFPNTRLVLAGKEVTQADVPEAVKLRKTVQGLSRPDQVHLLGFISDEELAWLYQHATAFVFPSRYEGFGLPILEAMQAGCPVITYDNSSLPEVAGKAALVVPDGESMEAAICAVLSSPAVHTELIKKGRRQAAKFTWQRTAKETLKVLEIAGRKS